ncbi:MAG TPA: hypothetical protein VEI06_04090 [Gemmatimonadaceae bacterium]|nr:hypothetical protein [Gemmatimonadaceae bacterium]
MSETEPVAEISSSGHSYERKLAELDLDPELKARITVRHEYPACAIFHGGVCNCDAVLHVPLPRNPLQRYLLRRRLRHRKDDVKLV